MSGSEFNLISLVEDTFAIIYLGVLYEFSKGRKFVLVFDTNTDSDAFGPFIGDSWHDCFWEFIAASEFEKATIPIIPVEDLAEISQISAYPIRIKVIEGLGNDDGDEEEQVGTVAILGMTFVVDKKTPPKMPRFRIVYLEEDCETEIFSVESKPAIFPETAFNQAIIRFLEELRHRGLLPYNVYQ